jgi:hypothetical protein
MLFSFRSFRYPRAHTFEPLFGAFFDASSIEMSNAWSIGFSRVPSALRSPPRTLVKALGFSHLFMDFCSNVVNRRDWVQVGGLFQELPDVEGHPTYGDPGC